MSLNWSTVDIPFGAGLDTKTNRHVLEPPKVSELINAVFPATGLSGYETRPGYDKIADVTEANGLFTRDTELCVITNNGNLYSVSESEGVDTLKEKGSLLPVRIEQSVLDTGGHNQTYGQIAEVGPIKVHCWLDSGTSTVQYTVSDSDKALLSNTSITGSSSAARLVQFENSIGIIYHDISTTALRMRIIPAYEHETYSESELTADVHNDGIFDVVEENGTTAFLSWKGDNSDVRAGKVKSTGVLTDNTEVQGSVDITCLAVTRSNTDYHIVSSTATTCSTHLGTALFSFSTETVGSITGFEKLSIVTTEGPDETDSTRLYTVFAQSGFTSSAPFNTVQFNTVHAFHFQGNFAPYNTADYSKNNLSIVSNAFLLNNQPCVVMAFQSPLQTTNFLVNQDLVVQGKFTEGKAIGQDHYSRVINNKFCAVYAERLIIDLDPSDDSPLPFAQYGLSEVEFSTSKVSSVEYGKTAYVAAGLLWAYDGNILAEQGFLCYPETFDSSVANSTGSLTGGKSYSYRVYYEWTNARGEKQRSTTANAITVDLGSSDNQVTLTVPTLSLTEKGNNVSIAVYRTEGNPDILGGAPFYRVSGSNPAVITGSNRYVHNDTSSITVQFTDDLSDTAIRSQELDYQNTNELDNTVCPTSHVIGESKNRVWVSNEPSTVHFSKLNTRGQDQLEFHDGNKLRLPEHRNEQVTGVAAINFHTVIFKSSSIYAVSGEGPNNLGSGFFNLPQIVSLDVGCVDQRSLVDTPQGVMFKSRKGIWLVTHNLETVYVGADVEKYNSQDITNALLIPEQNQVNFLTSEGRTLTYNYLRKDWGTYTNHEGNSGVLWKGVYTYLRTDGQIYKNGPTYSDAGTHYSLKFTTAPIVLKGPQGRQKIRNVRLLGTYYSPHLLRTSATYDHNDNSTVTATWDPEGQVSTSVYGEGEYGAGPYGGSGDPVYQARFNLPRQKCQSVQFTVDTKSTGSTGRAVSIQALQIEVGVKEGGKKMSTGRSFSE